MSGERVAEFAEWTPAGGRQQKVLIVRWESDQALVALSDGSLKMVSLNGLLLLIDPAVSAWMVKGSEDATRAEEIEKFAE